MSRNHSTSIRAFDPNPEEKVVLGSQQLRNISNNQKIGIPIPMNVSDTKSNLFELNEPLLSEICPTKNETLSNHLFIIEWIVSIYFLFHN